MTIGQARSGESELMDREAYDFGEYERALREIEIINRVTNGYAPTIAAIAAIARRHPGVPLRILDVGFGYGDTLRAIARWAKAEQLSVTLEGVDLQPWARLLAERETPFAMSIRYRTEDALSFDSGRFDVIVSSLFLHHLSDERIPAFLRWMTDQSRFGWFVNDLHRHAVAHWFATGVAKVLSQSRLVRHDAPLSVARAFRRSDWRFYLRQAGLERADVRIKWHWPFRYGVLHVADE